MKAGQLAKLLSLVLEEHNLPVPPGSLDVEMELGCIRQTYRGAKRPALDIDTSDVTELRVLIVIPRPFLLLTTSQNPRKVLRHKGAQVIEVGEGD